jgi:hypothetical protein
MIVATPAQSGFYGLFQLSGNSVRYCNVYTKEHTPRSHSLTVAEFAPQVEIEWQDRVANGELPPNTHRMYERVLLKQIVPLLGDELVCDAISTPSAALLLRPH